MEKKKNIIIVILIVVIGALFYYSFKQYNANKDLEIKLNESIKQNDEQDNQNVSSNNQNTNNDQNNVVNNTETITDDSTLKELRSIINVLLISDNHSFNTLNETLSSNYNYTTDLNTSLLESLTLSNEIKLQTILRSIYKTYETKINIAKENVSNTSFKNVYDMYKDSFNNLEEFSQIGIKYVEDAYMKLYGVTPNHQDIINNSCPIFYYDSVNKVYFKGYECGGTGPEELYTYINKVTKTNNTISLYLNVGLGDKETGKIYNEISKSKVVDSIPKINDVYQEYKIDTTNYTQFSEYKFTFEKNSDGNYIYKSIERIK